MGPLSELQRGGAAVESTRRSCGSGDGNATRGGGGGGGTLGPSPRTAPRTPLLCGVGLMNTVSKPGPYTHHLPKIGAHLVTALARLHVKNPARRSSLVAWSTREKMGGCGREVYTFFGSRGFQSGRARRAANEGQSVNHAKLEAEEQHAGHLLAALGLVIKHVSAVELLISFAAVLAVAADAVLVAHHLPKIGNQLAMSLVRLHVRNPERRSGLVAWSMRE